MFCVPSGDGVHLADQDYTSCIRSARTTCAICYYVAADTDFKVTDSCIIGLYFFILLLQLSTPENNAALASHDIDCGKPTDA